MARKQVGTFLKKDNQIETSFREVQNTGETSNVQSNVGNTSGANSVQNAVVNNNSIVNNKGDDDEGEEANTQLDHSTLLRSRAFEEENDVDEEEELWCICTEKRKGAVILMSCLTLILAVSIVSAIVYVRIYIQPVHGIKHHGHKHHINATKGPSTFTAKVTTKVTMHHLEGGNSTISRNSTEILQFTSAIQMGVTSNNSTIDSTTENATAQAVIADQTPTISTAMHDFLEGHVQR